MSELWDIERRLWLEGSEAYDQLMTPDCVMAFGPTGILQGQEILESLRQSPRWSDVQMSDQLEARPADDIAILAYRAAALRDGAQPYVAFASSTYVCIDGYWWIAQHQQTRL